MNRFYYIDSKYNYTVGSNDNELIPNRSISTNLFELGTFIYIPNFNLLNLSKITKDGCFRVDDNNGENDKITIFTGKIPTQNSNTDLKINIIPGACRF